MPKGFILSAINHMDLDSQRSALYLLFLIDSLLNNLFLDFSETF